MSGASCETDDSVWHYFYPSSLSRGPLSLFNFFSQTTKSRFSLYSHGRLGSPVPLPPGGGGSEVRIVKSGESFTPNPCQDP